jgi:hypothetical protein
MIIDFSYHPNCLLILPNVSLSELFCENRDEPHGWAFTIGFLLFSVSLIKNDGHDGRSEI